MNNFSYKAVAGIVTGALVCGIGVGAWFGRYGGQYTHAGHGTAVTDRQVLYWYDPMSPRQHFDKPGKSPFMDMPLVPKYAEDAATPDSVRIDPSLVQNLGVRLTTVERGPFPQFIDAVGSIAFNQRHVAVVQARSSGFVTRAYARASGDVIQHGAPLIDLLVPEWAGAQAEFLALLKSGDAQLVDAGRQRLMLLGMQQELIAQIESQLQPQPVVTIRAPIAGVIESMDAREGMTVSAGALLAQIYGLQTVWFEAAVPEAQGALIMAGKSADVRLAAYPGRVFKGRLVGFLPEANSETRTLRVRIELDNVDGRLRPGMFAQARLDVGESTAVLYVASEAIIHTGVRTVAIVAGEGGRFIPTQVQTGAEAGGKTVILQGLAAGQKVVASGQFLIDSEANLTGALARLGAKDLPLAAHPEGSDASGCYK